MYIERLHSSEDAHSGRGCHDDLVGSVRRPMITLRKDDSTLEEFTKAHIDSHPVGMEVKE